MALGVSEFDSPDLEAFIFLLFAHLGSSFLLLVQWCIKRAVTGH